MTQPIILHHYENSPYAEKVRLMVGLGNNPWQRSPCMCTSRARAMHFPQRIDRYRQARRAGCATPFSQHGARLPWYTHRNGTIPATG